MKKMILLSLLILSGCGLCPVKTEIVKVEVPVIVHKNPPVIIKPELISDKLKSTDGFDVRVKSLEQDLSSIKGYVLNLERTLKSYSEETK